MKHSQASSSTKYFKYPQPKWGNLKEDGLATALLTLIERDEAIRKNLYPSQYNPRSGQKKAQCRELVKTLLAGVPEVTLHLQTPRGLEFYTEFLFSKLQLFEERFIDVILLVTDPDSDMPPDTDKIEAICPSFFRIAPLLWEYISTKRDFKNPLVSHAINRFNLNFCTAITPYDPQRAAAQIAAQDAVLRRATSAHHILDNQSYHQGTAAAFVAFERINKNLAEEAGRGLSSKRRVQDPDYEPPMPKRHRRPQRLESTEPDPQTPEIVRNLRSGPVYRASKAPQ